MHQAHCRLDWLAGEKKAEPGKSLQQHSHEKIKNPRMHQMSHKEHARRRTD